MTKKRTSEHWPDIAAFKREGENWLTRQVGFDAGLPPQAMRVANVYRHHVNFELGYCEVSVDTVAEALGLSPDTVTRCNKALLARGHCDIVFGKGRSQTNRVGWIVKPETNTGAWRGLEHETFSGLEKRPANLRGLSEQEKAATVRGFETENPASVPEKPRKSAAKTPQECGTNILLNSGTNREGRALGRAPLSSAVSLVSDVVLIDIEDTGHASVQEIGTPTLDASAPALAQPSAPSEPAPDFEWPASDDLPDEIGMDDRPFCPVRPDVRAPVLDGPSASFADLQRLGYFQDDTEEGLLDEGPVHEMVLANDMRDAARTFERLLPNIDGHQLSEDLVEAAFNGDAAALSRAVGAARASMLKLGSFRTAAETWPHIVVAVLNLVGNEGATKFTDAMNAAGASAKRAAKAKKAELMSGAIREAVINE